MCVGLLVQHACTAMLAYLSAHARTHARTHAHTHASPGTMRPRRTRRQTQQQVPRGSDAEWVDFALHALRRVQVQDAELAAVLKRIRSGGTLSAEEPGTVTAPDNAEVRPAHVGVSVGAELLQAFAS